MRARFGERIRGAGGLGAMLLAGLLVLPTGAGPAAAEGAATVTIGESNSDAQRAELLGHFGAGEGDRVVTVTVAETAATTGDIFDLSGVDSAYSSTALTCGAAGDGLSVTTRNIEAVPPGLYALAMVTAGLDDAELAVAAPDDAPAMGMTALAGVFGTWDLAPCAGGATDAARQRLAFEQIAATVAAGEADGRADGVVRATATVLGALEAVVVGGLADEGAVGRALEEQADATNLRLGAEGRADLTDLLVRVGRADLAWGTFAGGWTTRGEPDGARFAIRGAGAGAGRGGTDRAGRAEATAAGGGGGVVTEPTRAAPTASATATATATATPSPAATPTPRPTASPGPIAVVGRAVGRDGDRLAVLETGGDGPVAYPVPADAPVVRDGGAASVGQIAEGDTVRLTVDPGTGRADAVEAWSASPDRDDGDRRTWLDPLGLLLLGALPGVLLVAGRRRPQVWRVGPARPAAPAPVLTTPGAPSAGRAHWRAWLRPRRRVVR